MAQRKGQEMPPIDVYRIGELHFVKDGTTGCRWRASWATT